MSSMEIENIKILREIRSIVMRGGVRCDLNKFIKVGLI